MNPNLSAHCVLSIQFIKGGKMKQCAKAQAMVILCTWTCIVLELMCYDEGFHHNVLNTLPHVAQLIQIMAYILFILPGQVTI